MSDLSHSEPVSHENKKKYDDITYEVHFSPNLETKKTDQPDIRLAMDHPSSRQTHGNQTMHRQTHPLPLQKTRKDLQKESLSVRTWRAHRIKFKSPRTKPSSLFHPLPGLHPPIEPSEQRNSKVWTRYPNLTPILLDLQDTDASLIWSVQALHPMIGLSHYNLSNPKTKIDIFEAVSQNGQTWSIV